jgi:hypothetical protein
MALAHISTTTETRAPNVAAIRRAMASIEGFGQMTASEQSKALKDIRKEHGSKHSTQFFLSGGTGIKVKVSKPVAMLLRDLDEVTPAPEPEAVEA